ncbi:hypothetical protein MN608_05827 [Microdochium nivale]|nr:hypothetical protein MN608_05827 [Microdochium nivale]
MVHGDRHTQKAAPSPRLASLPAEGMPLRGQTPEDLSTLVRTPYLHNWRAIQRREKDALFSCGIASTGWLQCMKAQMMNTALRSRAYTATPYCHLGLSDTMATAKDRTQSALGDSLCKSSRRHAHI